MFYANDSRGEQFKWFANRNNSNRHAGTKPTICELLGGEYSVHFDFCGKDTVARLDANSPVTPSDEIAVKFNFETMYVFDSITGDVIKGLTR